MLHTHEVVAETGADQANRLPQNSELKNNLPKQKTTPTLEKTRHRCKLKVNGADLYGQIPTTPFETSLTRAQRWTQVCTLHTCQALTAETPCQNSRYYLVWELQSCICLALSPS